MFTKNKITMAIGLTALLACSGANAAIIGLELAGEVNTVTTNNLDSNSDISATGVDVYASVYEDTSSAYGYSRASDSGWFYVTSGAYGIAAASSTMTQNYTITNDGSDAFFDFDFTVENGSLSVFCDGGFEGYDGYGDNDGYGVASAVEFVDCVDGTGGAGYTAEILVGNSVVWSSTASLDYANSSYSLTEAGIQLGTYSNGDSTYYWGEQSYNIDLGLIAANSTLEVSYVVSTIAASVGSTINSYAQFNDPNSFNQTPIIIGSSPATNVSAPSTLGMLGLSLFGFAAYRRKKLA